MTRHFWVLIQRWDGLATAEFLILVGLTGSLLAFLQEINHALTPQLFPANQSTPLKPGELALAVQDLLPQTSVGAVVINSSGSALVGFIPKIDPATGKPYQLGFNQFIIDAASGRELGRRTVGVLPTGIDNLMPFVYWLHMNLMLGIVALLWTLDCFVAFYLTFPIRRKKPGSAEPGNPPCMVKEAAQKQRNFWQRWKPAWLVKWRSSIYRVNFDLHRAGGLWLWLILLIFAWSSVGFSLHDPVYQPVMRTLFNLPPADAQIASPPRNRTSPMGWREAQTTAGRLMQEQAKTHGFTVDTAVALYRREGLGRYHYRIKSSLYIRDKNGDTELDFDMYSGQLLSIQLPATQYSGYTASAWLEALHEADVFGLPYCVRGLAIVMLSVTGIIIWLRKRRARIIHSRITA
ncbi:PepSY domain-containing protein [Candidatus Methylospira mobilis]|uniref:PepSY domain-containing protein n=1 Tax=Candidatus Methylospira mobilis TaxID=1808979 RepID=A0A5Q0BSB0_9GAMM|nr:PepSY-associated TM helix domain-containing protein [Candidatus Methylospira mobilis]QFY44576.1 PepSY domain-containing protein [Candidatus Methylospira mobilis]WNV05989.1 PepSY-associated TM helix domain-containing protein [Candidatus Methylospira mobilis]